MADDPQDAAAAVPTKRGGEERRRKVYLDGLRGVAALVVLVSHTLVAIGSHFEILFNGNGAVCIFFVLSGYVLTDFARRSQLSILAKAARRYIRLAAPMLITSVFSWALLEFGLYRNQEAAALTHSWWLPLWFNFQPSFSVMLKETLVGVFVYGEAAYNSNLWTMKPELIGSLYLFAINGIVRQRAMRVALYLAIAALHRFDYIALFSVGALLCEFDAELSPLLARARARLPILPLICVGAGIFLCLVATIRTGFLRPLFAWLPELQANDNNVHWHMIGACLLVATVLHWQFLQSVLSCPTALFLGKISFVLYLIQIQTICSILPWVLLLIAPISLPLAALVAAGSSIFATIVLAALTYRYADEWPTSISRKVGEWIDARNPFQAASSQ